LALKKVSGHRQLKELQSQWGKKQKRRPIRHKLVAFIEKGGMGWKRKVPHRFQVKGGEVKKRVGFFQRKIRETTRA